MWTALRAAFDAGPVGRKRQEFSMSLYNIIKFVHVLSAIIAVGLNVSYGIWIGRSRRSPEHMGFVLRGIKFLDDRIANPAYILLLITGIAMIIVGDVATNRLWIGLSIALYIVVAILGLGFYTPTLRRQIEAYDRSGPDDPEYQRLSKRGSVLGGVMGVIVFVIVFLMVVKPGL
jgi:uncharacterized membrane protein